MTRTPRPLTMLPGLVLAFAAPALAQLHGGAGAGEPAVGTGHDAAAGGHDAVSVIPTLEQGVAPMVTALVVFVVVLVALRALVWPKITGGLADREAKIRGEIEAAEQAQKKAQSALKEYERSLGEARAEAQRMLEETKAQQMALAADLRAKSEAELGSMRDRARRDIEMAKQQALAELYDRAGTLATDIARKILQREIGPQDQQRLVQESLSQLQSADRGAGW